MRRAWVVLGALIQAGPHPALAQATPLVQVVGNPRGCPTPAQVKRHLAPLLPGRRVVGGGRGTAAVQGVSVILWDRGRRYGVSAAATRRELVDEAFDCGERARAAALVAALALEPPALAAKRRSPAASARRAPLGAVLEVAPAIEGAPGAAGGGQLAGGLTVRGVLGRGRLGLSFGAGIRSPVTLDFGTVRARVWRAPFDLGLRAGLRSGRWEVAGDLGLSATLTHISGEGISRIEAATRLGLGIRLAAVLRVWIWKRFAPFLAAEVLLAPVPFDLSVESEGVVGSTARVHLGGTVGLAIRLH